MRLKRTFLRFSRQKTLKIKSIMHLLHFSGARMAEPEPTSDSRGDSHFHMRLCPDCLNPWFPVIEPSQRRGAGRHSGYGRRPQLFETDYARARTI